MMSLSELSVPQNEETFKLLFHLDEKISIAYRKFNKCSKCKHKLHVANYHRKPKGTLCENPFYTKRFSFCCSNKSNACRKRSRPPSLRYFMQFHYAALFFIIMGAMLATKGESINLLSKRLKIPRCTLKRWRIYWTQLFERTKRYSFIKSIFPAATIIPHYFVNHINISYLQLLDIFKSDDFVNLGGHQVPHNFDHSQSTPQMLQCDDY